jgi:16S rRNA (adenine1518-N6/adenine1519-N6)-dimethyltransferase
LRDARALERIADALALTGHETVVEIGPGRGALTDLLRERSGRVVAIELDRMLADVLTARYADDARVRIVQADALAIRLADVGGDEFVLVGNVPYYITTPLIFHALERPRPLRSVFLVQREVAERLAAPPGGKEYGALSVNAQAIADIELLFTVPARAFLPPPKVESAVVRMTPRDTPLISPDVEDRFKTFVLDIFGLRRKQMRRVLRTVLRLDAERADEILRAESIDPEARPETLTPAMIAALFQRIDASSGKT